MREASRLASSSCARYWFSTACASAWARSGAAGSECYRRGAFIRPSLPSIELLVLEDEGGDEADERQRLGQRETDPHVQLDAGGRLGLAGHGLDGVAEDQADADARADRGEAVAHCADVDADHLGGENGGCRH